jgi:hypothetical protein
MAMSVTEVGRYLDAILPSLARGGRSTLDSCPFGELDATARVG